jgi:DNA-directed RNA polymerase specialized sigma24 family protein
MSTSDSQRPSAPLDEQRVPRGVRVIVRNPPPPPKIDEEPKSDPFPQPSGQPRVVIRPPAEPGRARQAFFRELVAKYEGFILKLLLARRDVLAESAKDLSQGALEVLFNEAEANGLPPEVERFLGGVVRNLVRNRKRKWAPDIAQGAAADDVPWAAPDPAEEAEQAESWCRLFRYLATLSKESVEEAEAVQCVEVLGMTLAETAQELGRPLSSVAAQAKRGSEKLKELARASDRATELGLRRRDER